VDDLAVRLARLEAAAEIRQLVSRYSIALDARDVDALVGLFAEDVRVGLREAFFDAPLRRLGVTVLHVGTHVIDITGPDDARGTVYARAELEIGPGRWVSQAVHYGDRYVRRGGRWYFGGRRHELFYGVAHGRRPNGLPAANWPEHDTGAGTVPYRWPTWQSFWEESR